MKKLLILISIFTLINSSCSKYLDVNTDPAAVSSADPKYMITAAIVKAGYNTYSEISLYSGLLTNQTLGLIRQAQSISNYQVSAGDFDNLWNYEFYSSTLKAAYDLKEISKTKGQPHYQAIGNILLAYSIIQATDIWGDVPYSEAFLALQNIKPIYDPQQSIYTSADNLLAEAITLLSGPNNGFAISSTNDIIYNGKPTAWIKLAYSLQARNYIHLAKVNGPSSYAKALAAANMGFTSSADDALVNFVNNGAYNASFWYQFNTQRGDIKVHDYFINKLTSTNDPRLLSLVDTVGGANFVGPYLASENTKLPLMSYDELLFIIAEAEAGQGMPASTTLAKAISANLVRVTGSDDAAFASAQSADGSLANVMNQKYVALFLSPECWTDWRRTNFPALTPNTGSEIPRSLFYSAQEQKANSNCPANTTLFRRVWWDI